MNATLRKHQSSEKAFHQPSVPEIGRDQKMLSSPVRSAHVEPTTVKPELATPPAATRPPSQPKAMDKGRFAFGLALSSAGVSLLLLIAVGMLEQSGVESWLSLPLVALTAIFGVMMLGGGFGVMATASASLDDGEYERLINAGNISNVCQERSGSSDESLDTKHRSDVPTGRGREQGDTDEV